MHIFSFCSWLDLPLHASAEEFFLSRSSVSLHCSLSIFSFAFWRAFWICRSNPRYLIWSPFASLLSFISSKITWVIHGVCLAFGLGGRTCFSNMVLNYLLSLVHLSSTEFFLLSRSRFKCFFGVYILALSCPNMSWMFCETCAHNHLVNEPASSFIIFTKAFISHH